MSHRPSKWFRNWRLRHQTPLSFWLHVVGIPLTIAAVALAIAQLFNGHWELWWRPAALLVVGYALQYVGHRHEGNDLGEVILFKKLLGRPYTDISPRFAAHATSAAHPRPPRPPAPMPRRALERTVK